MARYEWPPLPIADTDDAAEALAEALARSWADLEAERVRVLLDPKMLRKREVDAWIKEFQAAIDRFGEEVAFHLERFAGLHLAPQYMAGVVASGGVAAWTAIHSQAFVALATDTYADFLARSQAAGETSADFARAVRAASRAEVPKLAAGGRTAAQAAERLEARLLGEYDITRVVYRNGARVPVDVYTRMAARTKSAVAYNAGTLNQGVSMGVKYVEVFDGTDCGWRYHEDLDKAAGSIRTLEEAAQYAISHPNCTRAFGLRPDIVDPAAASPSTTQEQRDDAAEHDWSPEKQAMRDRSRHARRQQIAQSRVARQERLRARYLAEAAASS
ncbi:hypothetical protein [Aeromicrobium sp. Leaf291]|uniref:hypothetical protein n=1 Tax=Aeromicrobium sp. Leaf291 TaxID=1736325 RepID=UPI0006F7540F|nr:hypothetical protein [Aeromicrobium sp. Leaf291]KQP81577.1 hypothetical protein ASF35_16230 [Aeromicrobium sp. Leaf291]